MHCPRNVIVVMALAFMNTIGVPSVFLIHFFDIVIAAGPDIRERFIKYKPVLIRNYPIISYKYFQENSQINNLNLVVIYVGLMSKERGTLELIKAFEYLDDVKLWLLGPFSDNLSLDECKSEKGWKNVNYLGVVNPNEVFKIINKANIGIITFLPKPNHINSLPNKPFEYMACGLPMVMSNFDYWVKTFKNGALYVNPRNSKDIAGKIKLLQRNRKMREEMGVKNLNLIHDKFNWDSEKKSLIRVYSNIKC